MHETSVIAGCIQRARRRLLYNLAWQQTALAVSLAMGGAILLLLVGTQILDWYWLVLLFGGSLLIGLHRTHKKLPSSYQVAQRIDQRLGLHDSLSTALHFSGASGLGKWSNEMVAKQREEAERLARSANVASAVPMALPRGLYLAVSLCLVAVGMFAVRYGVSRSLNLRRGMAQMAFEAFFPPDEKIAELKKNKAQRKMDEQLKKMGLSLDPPDARSLDTDAAPDSALSTIDTPDVSNADKASDPGAKSKGNGSQSQEAADGMDSSENADRASAGPGEMANDDSGNQDSAAAGAKPPPQAGQQASKAGNENNGLMDKMRDAMSNLLSKLKTQAKSGDSQSPSSSQTSAQNGKQPGNGQKGTPAPGRPEADGMPNSDAKSDSEGQPGDKSQSAQGKSGDRSAERQASQDAKSGIGKQDGNKDAREAEQLAAMGKISEIIGKRSQNVTGEVMVEVASGKQQLRTAYSQKNAAHAENAGGEINRDEVPLMYQQYVQQYLEEVRKQPAASSAQKPSKVSH